ncbi:hypothetical protein ACLOJK_018329 [Asimina triloba]
MLLLERKETFGESEIESILSVAVVRTNRGDEIEKGSDGRVRKRCLHKALKSKRTPEVNKQELEQVRQAALSQQMEMLALKSKPTPEVNKQELEQVRQAALSQQMEMLIREEMSGGFYPVFVASYFLRRPPKHDCVMKSSNEISFDFDETSPLQFLLVVPEP